MTRVDAFGATGVQYFCKLDANCRRVLTVARCLLAGERVGRARRRYPSDSSPPQPLSWSLVAAG